MGWIPRLLNIMHSVFLQQFVATRHLLNLHPLTVQVYEICNGLYFTPSLHPFYYGAIIYSRTADCWELTREKSYSKSKCDSFILFRKLLPQFSLYYKLYVEVIQQIFIKVTYICIRKKFKTIQLVFENI